MKKSYISILAVLLTSLVFNAPAFANQSGFLIADQIDGDVAYRHVENLSEKIGMRATGTPGEKRARNYVARQFKRMGYDVEIQPFEFVGWDDQTYASWNVIATKPGKLAQTVIVGAHYDSVPESEVECEDPSEVFSGAGDNASGVGVMLEVAEVLAKYKTRRTIQFIAFGGEEMGLGGSTHYAEQMTDWEISRTVAMINLDSVGVGDFFYVYSGLDDNPGWARDLALKIGQRMGYDLRTSPASEFFEYGTTGDWSDHVPFKDLGIPIAYFEWMNWDIEPNGGIETDEFGWIMHTCRDNLSFVSIEKLELTADVLGTLVFRLGKTKRPKCHKGKIDKGEKCISIQGDNGLPN